MADNFYGTVEAFKTYCEARGLNLPGTTDDDDIGIALLVASEWLDGAYSGQFPGVKVGGRAQVRQWPRYDVIDCNGDAVPSNAIPDEIERATYEACFRQITSPGLFFKDWTPSKYKSATVYGAVSVTYSDFVSAGDIQTQFPQIGAILSTLLCGGGFSPLSGGSSRV